HSEISTHQLSIGGNRRKSGFPDRFLGTAGQRRDGSTSPSQTLKPGCDKVLSENFSPIGSAIPNLPLGKKKNNNNNNNNERTNILTNVNA
ncbi:MAG: hypothetical protein GY696_16425, partial [Gammaproteobacteria bacterium]|nr:hypothetical protein [Gammaproteobacteria bacterium]